MMHSTFGTLARSVLIALARTWKPFSYCTRPQVSTSGWRRSGCSPADHHAGSIPLGMRCTRSGGSSKPAMTSLARNFDDAMTPVEVWASHDSTAWIVLGCPRGMLPPCLPRIVEWNVVTSGTSWIAASVLAAQPTCQSWAWTTSGIQLPNAVVSWTRWWFADAAWATTSSSGIHGSSAYALTTRTDPSDESEIAPGCPGVSTTTS